MTNQTPYRTEWDYDHAMLDLEKCGVEMYRQHEKEYRRCEINGCLWIAALLLMAVLNVVIATEWIQWAFAAVLVVVAVSHSMLVRSARDGKHRSRRNREACEREVRRLSRIIKEETS